MINPTLSITTIHLCFRESVKSGHHCCPCQVPPPPVLVTTSPSARIIRQSSQPEASACCCSGCCCPLHTGTAPSAASLRQLREPSDGIAGIAADSLRINGGIRQFRQVSATKHNPADQPIRQKGFLQCTHPAAAATTLVLLHVDARTRVPPGRVHTQLAHFLELLTPYIVSPIHLYVYHAFTSYGRGKPGCPFLLRICFIAEGIAGC